METNELLTSLAKLETSLKEIESAKEQVKQTVDAYTILQDQIKAYTHSLDSIKTSVDGIVSDLRAQRVSLGEEASGLATALEEKAAMLFTRVSESSSDVLTTLKSHLDVANELFSKDSKAVAESFKISTDDELVKLQQSVQTLKECATTLSTLDESIKNTLSQIEQVRKDVAEFNKALLDSQSAQDNILKQIQDSIVSLSQKDEQAFSNLSKSFESSMVTQNSVLNDIKGNLSTNLSNQERSFASISDSLESVKKDQVSLFSKITDLFSSESERFVQLGNNVLKENRLIKGLSITSIALVMALIVIWILLR